MGLETIALIGAVGSTVGTVASISAQRKATKAQQRQQELSSRRERMQAIRQAQIARATSTMTAVGSGSSESSGAAGGIGSISSQLGTDLGYASQMTSLSRDVSSAQRSASMWGGVANLGMTAFQTFGGGDWLQSKFGNPSAGPTFTPYNSPRPRQRPA